MRNLFSSNNPENNLNNVVQIVLNDGFGHFKVFTFLVTNNILQKMSSLLATNIFVLVSFLMISGKHKNENTNANVKKDKLCLEICWKKNLLYGILTISFTFSEKGSFKPKGLTFFV